VRKGHLSSEMERLDRATAALCERCGVREARYDLPVGMALIRACLLCFVRSRWVVVRALATAAVVGTILTLINQGDLLLRGDLSTAMLFKIPLTYVVPYTVTVWGTLAARR